MLPPGETIATASWVFTRSSRFKGSVQKVSLTSVAAPENGVSFNFGLQSTILQKKRTCIGHRWGQLAHVLGSWHSRWSCCLPPSSAAPWGRGQGAPPGSASRTASPLTRSPPGKRFGSSKFDILIFWIFCVWYFLLCLPLTLVLLPAGLQIGANISSEPFSPLTDSYFGTWHQSLDFEVWFHLCFFSPSYVSWWEGGRWGWRWGWWRWPRGWCRRWCRSSPPGPRCLESRSPTRRPRAGARWWTSRARSPRGPTAPPCKTSWSSGHRGDRCTWTIKVRIARICVTRYEVLNFSRGVDCTQHIDLICHENGQGQGQ